VKICVILNGIIVSVDILVMGSPPLLAILLKHSTL